MRGQTVPATALVPEPHGPDPVALTSYLLSRLVSTEISQETAVNPVDIVSTLQSLQMLKYWKGKHLVLKRQVRNTVMRFQSQM